jgi:hypothetical protein
MNSPAGSAGTAPVREDGACDRTAQLLAEAANRLSAHTSALNSVALRMLAIEGGLAGVRAAASHTPAREEAQWGGALPAESSSKTLAAVSRIRLLAIRGVEGNRELEELALLASFARLAGARAIFVFRTLDGRAAVNLAANCATGGTVSTLDLPSDGDATGRPFNEHGTGDMHAPPPARCYEGTAFEPSIVQLRGDSAEFDFSRCYGAMDFVLIDGCENYNDVMKDTRTALRLLRDGRGLITWRGYSSGKGGVVRALEELHAAEPKLAGMRHVEGTALVYARVERAGTIC